MEAVLYVLAAFGCVLALCNWRWGVYAGIALDVLRDPFRKLAEDQSVTVTLAGAAVWAVVAVQAIHSEGALKRLIRTYPQFRTIVTCLGIAILPAAAISMVLYSKGYMLAAIGMASYVAPLLGLCIGFVFARSEAGVFRMLSFYSIVNAIALVSVPLEYFESGFPGLGGINMEWVRYRQGYTVQLISGFYRSPDIMGLHAAHVFMFSMLLAYRRRQLGRAGWLAIAAWAAICILLCGRRKMIGIPLVFLAGYVAISMWRGTRRVPKFIGVAGLGGLLAAGSLAFFWSGDRPDEYTEYASTTVTEFHSRINDNVIGGAVTTLQQVGVFGGGLGTATQGRYYTGANTGSRSLRGWQEDGFSKLFMELGIGGVVALAIAGFLGFKAFVTSLRVVHPLSSSQNMQIGLLGIVLGNAASFVVSHQQFSGDAVNSLMATLLGGIVLAGPALYGSEFQRRQQVRTFESPSPDRTPAVKGEIPVEAT